MHSSPGVLLEMPLRGVLLEPGLTSSRPCSQHVQQRLISTNCSIKFTWKLPITSNILSSFSSVDFLSLFFFSIYCILFSHVSFFSLRKGCLSVYVRMRKQSNGLVKLSHDGTHNAPQAGVKGARKDRRTLGQLFSRASKTHSTSPKAATRWHQLSRLPMSFTMPGLHSASVGPALGARSGPTCGGPKLSWCHFVSLNLKISVWWKYDGKISDISWIKMHNCQLRYQ